MDPNVQGFRIAGNKGIWIIAACQVPLMAGPEYARWVGVDSLQPVGVFLPGSQEYPGGVPFDPLGFSERPQEFLDQQARSFRHKLVLLALIPSVIGKVVHGCRTHVKHCQAQRTCLVQVKEIKNGRLAMVAMLGFFAQAAATREGPLKNLMAVLP